MWIVLVANRRRMWRTEPLTEVKKSGLVLFCDDMLKRSDVQSVALVMFTLQD